MLSGDLSFLVSSDTVRLSASPSLSSPTLHATCRRYVRPDKGAAGEKRFGDTHNVSCKTKDAGRRFASQLLQSYIKIYGHNFVAQDNVVVLVYTIGPCT